MKSPQKIAWIGAGKMGLPICKRLKATGYDVRVLARRPEQAAILKSMDFAVAENIPELLRDAPVIFTSVTDDQALVDIVLNNNFIGNLAVPATFIDMSTVSPSISEQIAKYLPPSCAYLRSPVSGSTGMAEAGTLTALISGPLSAFNAMADIFAVFSKKSFHVGEAEEARYLKLAINSMVAATSALLGEALAFGQSGGLDNATMLEVMTQSAIASPLIGYKKEMIISGDYTAAATLNMLLKDLELFISAGESTGLKLPVNSGIKRIYEAASTHGLGEKDFFILVDEAAKSLGNRHHS